MCAMRGGHWWSEAADPTRWHGPFATHEKAKADSIWVTIGPDAKVEESGVLHDAPQRKQ
jgi:hypothetical protein